MDVTVEVSGFQWTVVDADGPVTLVSVTGGIQTTSNFDVSVGGSTVLGTAPFSTGETISPGQEIFLGAFQLSEAPNTGICLENVIVTSPLGTVPASVLCESEVGQEPQVKLTVSNVLSGGQIELYVESTVEVFAAEVDFFTGSGESLALDGK